MAIRPATPGDLDALLRLYVQLSAGNAATDPARTANAFAAMLRTPNLHLLVATVGELVVGTVTVVIVPNLTHNATPWAQLENMVVDETRRGKGVGQQLLRAAVDLAWEAGCYKVQLQSANEREDAHRFYAAFGFAPSSVGFRLYR
ncbi:MAG: GNAT family N-acetyltransferase [Chloroflexi bacterium]|nr:GNAT family N-acetyltransferase [Chloroflexota bacterium]